MLLQRKYNYSLTIIVIVLFLSTTIDLSAQKQSNESGPSYVKNEVEFAGVKFSLSELSKLVLNQEIESINNNLLLKESYLQKLGLVLPIVEKELSESGVPQDFKYLSVYNRFQKSLETTALLEKDVFWCFDKAKAYEVDVVVNEQIDERKHIIASTDGAILCFKKNYVGFENWASTMFAHIADKQVIGALDISKKWSKNNHITLSSPAYFSVVQFLAFKIAMEQALPYYKPIDPKVLMEYENIHHKKLGEIAAELKVDLEQLKKTNSWSLGSKLSESENSILVEVPSSRYIEVKKLIKLSQNIEIPKEEFGFPVIKSALNNNLGRGGEFFTINDIKGIKAESCDSPIDLAYKSGIKIEQFVKFNDISEKQILSIGQVYYLEEKKSKGPIPFHIVKQNESLWEIAHVYGLKLEELLKKNGLDNVQRLAVGRVLWLQKKRPSNIPVEIVQPESIEKEIATDLSEVFEEELAVVNINTEKKENISQEIFTNEIKVDSKNENSRIETILEKPKPKEVKIEEVEKILAVQVSKKNNFETKSEKGLKDYMFHTVRKGETLYRISVNYKVSVDQLYKLNGLRNNEIEVGDTIKVKPL